MSKPKHEKEQADQVEEKDVEQQEDVVDEVESDEDEDQEEAEDEEDEVVEAVEPDTAKKAVEKPASKQKKGTVLLRFKADKTYNVGDVYTGKDDKEFRKKGLIV